VACENEQSALTAIEEGDDISEQRPLIFTMRLDKKMILLKCE